MEVKHEFPNAETFYVFIEAKFSCKSFFSIFFVFLLFFFSSFVGSVFSIACQPLENVHLGCLSWIVVCRVLYLLLPFRFGTGFLITSIYYIFYSFSICCCCRQNKHKTEIKNVNFFFYLVLFVCVPFFTFTATVRLFLSLFPSGIHMPWKLNQYEYWAII